MIRPLFFYNHVTPYLNKQSEAFSITTTQFEDPQGQKMGTDLQHRVSFDIVKIDVKGFTACILAISGRFQTFYHPPVQAAELLLTCELKTM